METALSLSLYIFAMITLTIPMLRLDIHRNIQQLMEAETKTISIAAYSDEKVLDTDYKPMAIATAMAAGGDRLGIVWAWNSGISDDKEWIVFDVKADMTLPFSVFNIRSIPVHVVSRRHLWNGVPGGRLNKNKIEAEDSEYVYIGRNSTRYHVTNACHYLFHNPTAVTKDSIGELRNGSGGRYKPCDRCGGAAGAVVYVLPEGDSYHSVSDCSSLRAYVDRVEKSSVEHLGPCSYCSGGRG